MKNQLPCYQSYQSAIAMFIETVNEIKPSRQRREVSMYDFHLDNDFDKLT